MLITTAVSEIRRGLGRPHEGALGDDQVIMDLWQTLTFYKAMLNLTHEPWAVRRWDFTVPASTDTELEIDAAEFGSEIFVQTKDDTNPYFIKRTINCIRPEQMTAYYSGPTNLPIGGSWYSPHVAIVFSIFREITDTKNRWKIQWSPVHQTAAEYTLWYVQGASETPPLFEADAVTTYPIEDLNWLVINDCILNLFPHLADEEIGLNAKQQNLFDIAKKKVEQWATILEAKRWDGPRREQTQRRKIFGQRRSGGSTFF